MEETEYTNVYQQLAAALNELGLKWVTQQVAETIRDGKTIEDRMPRRMYPALKIEDYTTQEQLLLLINALEQAVVNMMEIEAEVTDFLEQKVSALALKPEITFYAADESEESAFKFTPYEIPSRRKQVGSLKRTLEKLRTSIIEEKNSSSFVQQISQTMGNLMNPHLNGPHQAANLFTVYIFSIVLKAAQNEGALITYKNVFNETPESLVFRDSPSKIHGTSRPYTYAMIEFPGKPGLEVHLGIKIQGRSWVLHECDLLVLQEQEAYLCRTKKREPRPSRVVLVVEAKHHISMLKLNLARSFLGLISDIRIRGDCYFVTNSTSEPAAKLLTISRKKWEHNIFPGSTNDVNRLMYSLQSLFKDYKARY